MLSEGFTYTCNCTACTNTCTETVNFTFSLTDNFYTCTKEILAGLGQMYVLDERFRENIDQNGRGTAEFASQAIGIYCRK